MPVKGNGSMKSSKKSSEKLVVATLQVHRTERDSYYT